MKKEEDRSYSILFFISSVVLIFTFAWVVWDEVHTIRPWKKYQREYYELEVRKARDQYNEALKAFQNPVIQKEYKVAQGKLNKALEDFKKPQIQEGYKKILAELQVLDKKELAPLSFKAIVNRNELMEQAYLYGKYKKEETRKRIKEMEARNEQLTAKVNSVKREKAKLQKRLGAFKQKIDKYAEQVKSYTEETDRYREIMQRASSKRPELQVYQVYFEDLNEADRCMSCHVGINKNKIVSEEQPYARHPEIDVYLGNHPPETFGCVLCHEGQGRANMDVEMAHGEVEFWLKPMFRGKMAQASCIKCHDKGVELEGGDVIWKGLRLFRELGCNGCHKAEGFGKDKYRMIGPDLTEISSKVSAGWLVEWLKDPKEFRPTTRMPAFKLEEDEAKAISSYLWQNSIDVGIEAQGEYDEEMIEEGAFIFESVGCLACHRDQEDTERTHGPNLARIGEKVNYEYLVSWLIEPEMHQPRTRMPDLRLDEEDARFLAAYLMSLKSAGYREASGAKAGWLDDKELAGRGEKLISRYGCFACHKIKGMEDKGRIGVELTEVGSKEIHFFDFGLLEKEILGEVGMKHVTENVGKARNAWISAKLSDPRQFDKGRYRKHEEKLKMPDFGLNKDEVEALMILLSGFIGEKLPEKYMAKLTEKESRLAEGKRVLAKYNCMGCHLFSIDRLYLEDGTVVNGMVKLEEGDSIFFQLWEDNEKLGRKAGETTQIKKGQIKKRIRSKGGDIAPFIIDYYVEAEGMVPEEAKVFTPPVLYGEGKKVQFPWLFKFLNKPANLRPWLEVKMPTFNFKPGEAASVVGYFAEADDQQYPYEFYEEIGKEYIEKKEKEEIEKKRKGGYLAKARNLFESKNVNCASCHVRGDINPEGDPADWAPDLSLASKRLKPGWIVRWLLNPQLIQPGTKMPRFFRKGAFQEIFPGMPEEQAESIKDLLMNFPQDMLISEEDKSVKSEELDKSDKSVKNELSNTIEKTKES